MAKDDKKSKGDRNAFDANLGRNRSIDEKNQRGRKETATGISLLPYGDTKRRTAKAIKATRNRSDKGGTWNTLGRISEIIELLIDPIADIIKAYDVPREVFQKSIVTSALLSKNKAAYIPDPTGSDTNILQFNQEYLDDPSKLPEYFADIAIHEIGHILANYKNFAYMNGLDDDQTFMPLVPQATGKCAGMNEGFAELLRLRFSSELNRFPNVRRVVGYQQSELGSLDSLLLILEEQTILDRLMSDSYYEGTHVVPSILYYAQEQGKYQALIKDYNSFIRASFAKTRDLALLQHLGKSINIIFMR